MPSDFESKIYDSRQKFIDDLLLLMEKHSAVVNVGDCECACDNPAFGGPTDGTGVAWLLEMPDLEVEASKRRTSIANGELIPGLNRAVSGVFGSMLQIQFFHPKIVVPPANKFATSDRLLLVIDDVHGVHLRFGHYIPGIKVWRIEGSPSDWEPAAWAYAPDESMLEKLKV